MLTIFTAIIGLAGGFLPELLKYFNKRLDNAHELDMFKLQVSAMEMQHRDKLEEINAEADIAESEQLHAPMQSFGVQFLDKMHDIGVSQWMLMPMLWMYAFLDLLQGIVRPGITLAMTAFYMLVKYDQYQMLQRINDGDKWYDVVGKLWTTDDANIFVMVLAFWFGNRMAQKAFGSKANGWSK